MNIFSHFETIVRQALERLAEREGRKAADLPLAAVKVEPPRERAHGDLATNAALVLARPLKRKPREIAELLADELHGLPEIAAIEVAGPGFVNLRLASDFLRDRLPEILREGTGYGASIIGGGEKVNIEYVSANPTGPMHVGHVRGAVVGDALANLLEKAGYAVHREYYINDAGGQITTLARSVHLRYREACGEPIGEIPPGLYPGDYLIPLGKELARIHGRAWLNAPEEVWLEPIREFAVERMMEMIRDDLAALGVHHETFFSERELHRSGRVERTIAQLAERGLVYRGVLEPPKGKRPDDWEPREQLLFRATAFGDDVDRPLQKSDGSYTYFAADIAYHADKIARGFTQLIDVLGADHGGYVKRMTAAVRALSDDQVRFDALLCQMVRLLRGGEPVKMSKRSGTFVTLREVVDEVGRDVVRFIMLTRKNDAQLDFDFEKVKEQTKDNPVFYVQYAHARSFSARRKAAEHFPDLDLRPRALAQRADLRLLDRPEELALIRRLLEWPRLVEQAAREREPHRVAFYLYDLAAEFHALWNLGNDDPEARFVQPGKRDLTLARLALVAGVAGVIASGLAILGVTPREEMR
ncbi:MAG: arginine--tRNA ligase [Alphaproteobacteria bacterium]|nr:MAG: arginine--tRNA ligase [Alphaproteobacteria bacterium]